MSSGKLVLETERLILREITEGDAAFILRLVNTPKFHRYIADRGVRTVAAARVYLEEKYLVSYADLGYGLYAVCLKDGTPIGNCGFVRRDTLPGPDVGFAFLPEYERRGYGYESASAVIEYGRDELGFADLYAITSLDNDISGSLLEKLGFTFEREIESGDVRLKLFVNRSPA